MDPAAGRAQFGSITAEFVERKGDRAETTLATRESQHANWVAPYWKGWRVGDISPDDVDQWVEWMRDEGAKADTIQKAYRIVTGAVRLAVARRLIAESPASSLKAEKRMPKPRRYLSNVQVAELAQAIDPRYRLLIGVLCYTGLRFGEAAALRCGEVDLLRRRIAVIESVAEVHGKLVWGMPKGKERRTVVFPKFLAREFEEAMQGRGPDGLLFPAPKGGALRLNTWRRREFAPTVETLIGRESSAPFPSITPHDLRHTAASLAVQAGANVKALQRMLGHKSAALTLDVYADLYDSDLDEVATRMDTAGAELWAA